jgi:hypothetical protein
MTVADLLTNLVNRRALRSGGVSNIKTSLGYLARALGHARLDQCPVGETCREPDAWLPALETHFQALTDQGRSLSAATRRNTRNNLRVFFRAAAAEGLLAAPLPAPLLAKPKRVPFLAQQRATAPYQATYHPQACPRRYGIPRAAWPPDIVAGWQDYQARCDGRVRETTFQDYTKLVSLYLGYLALTSGRTPTWGDLFDPDQLRAYVRWHAARSGRPRTMQGRATVTMVCAVAKVIDDPRATELAVYHRGLKPPAAVHNKRAHWVSLAELDAVADACLAEGRAPVIGHANDNRYPGARRATMFQKGVILKLLVRVPLRQRNIREMQLDKNLYQEQGHWHLHFQGDELKIGVRGGEENTYHRDLTAHYPDVIRVLEEWLDVHRRKLPGWASSPLCFLTQAGRPFTTASLSTELRAIVALRTGKRFYPHLIRSIWITEYMDDPDTKGDYLTAAIVLGDTLQTALKSYPDPNKEAHYDKAAAFHIKRVVSANGAHQHGAGRREP